MSILIKNISYLDIEKEKIIEHARKHDEFCAYAYSE